MQYDRSEVRTRTRFLTCLPIALTALAFLLLGLLGTVFVLLARRMPPLTEEAFSAAQARWERSRPTDYEIEIEVTGRQPAIYRVSVEGGRPTAAFRNDVVLPQMRVWTTWTVEGMFSTIRSDLDAIARSKQGRSQSASLMVCAEFDERYGYPKRYLRIELGQVNDTSWIVRRFETPSAAVERPKADAP